MKLSAISFENYKAFPNKESIEIRPLTILIGRNSSGKSVIARLPMLISRALSEQAEAPMELDFNGLDFGSSFLDFIHNRTRHGSLSIGATIADEDGNKERFCVKLQHFIEYSMLLVSRFEYFSSSGKSVVLEWNGRDPLTEGNRYRVRETGNEYEIFFKGFFPRDIASIEHDAAIKKQVHWNEAIGLNLPGARLAFANALKNITYLGAFRQNPQRSHRFPGASPRGVGSGGGKAPGLLGDDDLRRRGRLVEAVGEWYKDYLGGWPLGVARQGDNFSLVLRNPRDPSIEVNIVDAGTGASQVLPLVVQRQFEAIIGENANLEIVEQPELHLHPKAHTVLADLYGAALGKPEPRFIIETHSENFLLRIRRRVAEGALDPNKVIIYWVNDESDMGSRVQPIHIDSAGDVDGWPTGVFAEDFEEVRAIRMAQKEKRG